MAPETATAPPNEFLQLHARLLARLYGESGGERWQVTADEFSAALYGSAAHRFGQTLPAPDVVATFLSGLHLSDLALACALRRGSTVAWEAFVADYRPILYAAARAVVGMADEARSRELADSLYAELYGLNRSGVQGRPLLDYFHGRSKLSTWLRTVLAQRHVDSLRATQHVEQFDEEATPSDSLARDDQSSQEIAGQPDRARLLPRLRSAVTDALGSAAPSDRLLLSLYYAQEMTLAQIARLQGVHEATISRQLERIRRELRQRVESSLVQGGLSSGGGGPLPGLSRAEVELCFSYAVEDWSFDLGATLRGNPVPEDA